MSNEIVLRKQEVTSSIVDMAIKLSEYAWASQLFGVAKKETATMIMLRGYELGFSLTSSFEYFDVINGKISIKPMGALALLNMHPEIIKSVSVEELEENGKFIGTRCTIERQDGGKFTTTYTLDDAKKADLVQPKSNWEKYPKNMCRWRTIGFTADLAAPEILGGLTVGLKMGEQLQENDLDTTIEAVPVINIVETLPQTVPAITLSELTSKFKAEQIMAANDGKVPATNEECAAIYTKLSMGSA